MKYILALDIGVASVGWAVLDRDVKGRVLMILINYGRNMDLKFQDLNRLIS